MIVKDYPKIKRKDYVYFSEILENSLTLNDLISGLEDFRETYGNHNIDINSSEETSSISAHIEVEREETDSEHRRRCQIQMESEERTKNWQRKEYERLKAIFEEENKNG